MKKLILSVNPRAATQKVLRILPNQRLRDIMERRYGLKSGRPETLEAIGKSYHITRERVRQIEEDGLHRLSEARVADALQPVFSLLEKHLEEHGGAAEEQKLLHSVSDQKSHAHVLFLLTVAGGMSRKPEDARFHHRWFTRPEAVRAAETVLEKTVAELQEGKKSVSRDELLGLVRNHTRAVGNEQPSADMLDSYLGISRLIKKNPYGEYGLAHWPTISPRGVRDKAFAVLSKVGSPMHFRDVAGAIDKAGWVKKRAHPQTVHNELIKDPRFVLVGRGLYALKDWGYEPGTVADMIVSVLKKAGKAISKDEIVRRVLEKRQVKENTVLLNLQNKRRFQRKDGGYALV